MMNTHYLLLHAFWGHSQRTSRRPRGWGGLPNSGFPLLFECDSIVSSGRRGEGDLEILVLAERPL